MAEMATIEMRDRDLYAALAMQALITREGWAADMVAKQAVAYADLTNILLRQNGSWEHYLPPH